MRITTHCALQGALIDVPPLEDAAKLPEHVEKFIKANWTYAIVSFSKVKSGQKIQGKDPDDVMHLSDFDSMAINL